jgi:hypothetical protein
MIIGHPIRQIRRHQQHLPPITSNEVLSHTQNLLNQPGRQPLPDSHCQLRVSRVRSQAAKDPLAALSDSS